MNITCLWVNDTTKYRLPDGWLEFAVLFYVSGTLLAMVGNFLVLLTVIRRPVLHRVSYHFVAALSLEDLIHGVIGGTTRSLGTINGCWPYGGATCVLFGRIIIYLAGVEFLLLVTVTVDRYIACCMPLRYAVLVTQKRCKSVIAGCWIYPAVFAILPFIGFNSYQYSSSLQICVIEWSSRPMSLAYTGLLTGTTFVPCTVVIVLCQVKIYKQVKRVTDQPLPQVVHSGTSSAIVMVSSRPTKAALTVFLITVIYFLSWMPFVGVFIVRNIVEWQKRDVSNLLGVEIHVATLCINMLSKFANPIVYGVYNKEFRRECIKLFRK